MRNEIKWQYTDDDEYETHEAPPWWRDDIKMAYRNQFMNIIRYNVRFCNAKSNRWNWRLCDVWMNKSKLWKWTRFGCARLTFSSYFDCVEPKQNYIKCLVLNMVTISLSFNSFSLSLTPYTSFSWIQNSNAVRSREHNSIGCNQVIYVLFLMKKRREKKTKLEFESETE